MNLSQEQQIFSRQIALLIIFLQRECTHETPCTKATQTLIDTIHDTVPYPVPATSPN